MYIYKTTNLITGLIYVGLSSLDSTSQAAKCYYGSSRHIKNVILKYGVKSIKKEIIEDNITSFRFLCKREIFWIAFYNACNPLIGYNILPGGSDRKHFRHTEKTKKQISDKQKGKVFSEKHKQRISNKKKGQKVWNEGLHHSIETKNKISKANKGHNLSIEHKKLLSLKLSGKKHSQQHIDKVAKAKTLPIDSLNKSGTKVKTINGWKYLSKKLRA